MLERFYRNIGSLFPSSLISSTQLLLIQSGIDRITSKYYLGFSAFFSTAISLIIFLIAPFFTSNNLIIYSASLAVLIFMPFLFYFLLIMRSESRASKIETILPDALQIIASNIRAGMILENAIWSSARPEFGPLRDEINKVSADTFAGIPISEGLLSMSKRVRSTILSRAMKLVVEGIDLGGEMSHLLDEVAQDIRSTQLLRKEIATTTLTYAIFIVFAAVIAAPLLFSISTFYSQMNEKLTAHTQSSSQDQSQINAAAQRSGFGGLATLGSIGSGSTSASKNGINSTDVYWFSLFAIIITTFFASLILGEIQTGSVMQGAKFVPLFVPIAVGVFLITLTILQTALGGLLK